MTALSGQPSPLVSGRRRELADAETAVAMGAGVVFAGPAGVGKTRLGREVMDRFAAAGHGVIHVAGTQAAASIPFGAFARYLDYSAGVEPIDMLRHIVTSL